MKDRTCKIDGCERGGRMRRGWCGIHYHRWLRHGDPFGGGTSRGEPMAHYLAHVDDVTDDCILWPYGLTAQGYAQTYVNGVSIHAHVLACEHGHGPKPDGHEVCHSCRNRNCFNPRHLRWGTRKENSADMIRDGTDPRGERNGHAVLTESDVINIRRRYADGGITQQALADEYGMARSSISGYTNGHRWSWL